MSQQPSTPLRALTKEQIALISRHAAERAELEGNQHNDRVAQQERHREEAIALGTSMAEKPTVEKTEPQIKLID